MFEFFARPGTITRLREPSATIVFLIGGFNGYWNFGDLMQLLGAVRWHRANQPGCVICPLLDMRAISSDEDIALLSTLFRNQDWLVYASDEQDYIRAAKIGLQKVSLLAMRGNATLHVYGGGFLNSFYGDYLLALMEQMLDSLSAAHYVLSGQQLGPEYARRLADHCLKFKPDIVGCRDPLSISALAEYGLNAVYSGDDAFEQFMSYRDFGEGHREPAVERIGFGINVRLTKDTYRSSSEDIDESKAANLVKNLDAMYRTLVARFGSACCPLVVATVLDARDAVPDSWGGIRGSMFSQYFPQFSGLDLSGMFMNGQLAEATSALGGLQLFVGMSYHATLLSQTMGVPGYLLAFNRYFEQKQQGLEQRYNDLDDFLRLEPAEILARQEEYLLQLRERRESWLRMMADAVGVNLVEANAFRHIADNQAEGRRFWLRLAERQSADASLRTSGAEARVLDLEGTLEALKQQGLTFSQRLSEMATEKSALDETVGNLGRQNSELLNDVARLSAEKSALDERVENLGHQNSELLNDVAQLSAEKSALNATVESLGQQNSELLSDVARLSAEKSALNATIENLGQQNSELLSDVARLSAEKSALNELEQSVRQQNSILADEILKGDAQRSELNSVIQTLNEQRNRLQEQLDTIHRSRSWRLVQGYWHALDSPVVGKFLRPVRWISLKAFWRGDKEQ